MLKMDEFTSSQSARSKQFAVEVHVIVKPLVTGSSLGPCTCIHHRRCVAIVLIRGSWQFRLASWLDTDSCHIYNMSYDCKFLEHWTLFHLSIFLNIFKTLLIRHTNLRGMFLKFLKFFVLICCLNCFHITCMSNETLRGRILVLNAFEYNRV